MKIADHFPSFINDFDRVLELYDEKMDDMGNKKEEEVDNGILIESYQGSYSTAHAERSTSPAEKESNEREDNLLIMDAFHQEECNKVG
ncbi:hypothetical protein F3Y22_tig00112503pilonHSYRG00333 [Hibiscus syriacus]|uniref:Uncharacterized protein n=1 Tax=Hibiscus syriacus TaxID=106335 RepID=A0A6A2Y8S6_HIBSY|nr:hypothetical protein F3Y22_tig00112503pilonHSYRG00333 [Hibiscus syriacus]